MEKAFSRPGWNGLGDKLFQSLYLIGRLKPGVTAVKAGAETVGMPVRGASSALPQTVVRILTGYTKINYSNPLGTVNNPFTPGLFALPASTFTIASNLLPLYTQD